MLSSNPAKRSQQIQKQLQKQHAKEIKKRGPKLLLLGAGDSGKTTVLKQIKLIHTSGFSDAERQMYKRLVLKGIVDGIKAILDRVHVPQEFYRNQVLEFCGEGIPLYIMNAIT